MKKIIILSILFLGIATINIGKCYALSIKTLETEIDKNKVTISGKVEKGMQAVAIFIYDEKEKELIDVRTTYVDDDNEYEETVKLDKDEIYVIKVADYDGGKYMETKINAPEETESIENVNTNDNIINYIYLISLSLISLLFIKRLKDC